MKSKETAIFGAGCFWGVEYVFAHFPGVLGTKSGFMGGRMKNPSYEDVCSGNTGHTEVVKVDFNPKVISYKKLLDIFFRCHDPTSIDRQGPDIGNQYRSVIFYLSGSQKSEAEKARKEYERKIGEKIATSIEKASSFYEAEEEHQNYYAKSHGKPYCHVIPKL